MKPNPPLLNFVVERNNAEKALVKTMHGFFFDATAIKDVDKATERLHAAITKRAEKGVSTPVERRN